MKNINHKKIERNVVYLVKFIRKKTKISQVELSEKLDTTQSTVSKIENENATPTLYTTVKLVAEYRIDPRRLKTSRITRFHKHLLSHHHKWVS